MNLFLFFPDVFDIFFHNTLLTYNTRNQINDTTESQKEKKPPVSMLIFRTVSQKSWD